MTNWDESFDFVIVGSGGGGVAAALAAVEAGLKPVILEKQQYVGGSTAMSGGVIWMPNNPLMRAEGIPDSYEAGLQYLQSVVGDPDDGGSTLARREAFLKAGPELITLMQRAGIKLMRSDGYSDYYDNVPGGHARGRSVEGIPWDGKQLGEWHEKVNPGMARGFGLAVTTNEVRSLAAWRRSAHAFSVTAKVVARTKLGKLRGKDLLTNGMSMIGQMTKILLDRGVPIWLNSGVEELIVEGGRVVGVKGSRNGVPMMIGATGGVLLSAGGFERNGEMRMKYSADTQPSDGSYTLGNPGNTGEVLSAAIALGAKTDYMDDAIWLLKPRAELGLTTLTLARQYPHTIFVNSQGRRFVNESNSYIEVGKACYANDAVPAWLVFDDDYRRQTSWVGGLPKLRHLTQALPGRLPEEYITKGWIKRADTIEELARQIQVDPAALAETIRKWNEGAVKGLDPEFHRGESQYNKVLGDPGAKLNPAVGPIARGPFYATEIFPGDVGTVGGVVCNEHAQVLDQRDIPIPGLYAAGNMAATVVGRTYPGAGASIANTMVFGYVAAKHVAEAVNRKPLASV